MSYIGGAIGYQLLRIIHPPSKRHFRSSDEPYKTAEEKLLTHFGPAIFDRIKGTVVIDFGSGNGRELIEFAKRGAKRVIGIEIQQRLRDSSIQQIQSEGFADICTVAEQTDEKADTVISLDSFEHVADPAKTLDLMSGLLKDDGEVWVSFGWPWYHPNGGHLFAVFPWRTLSSQSHAYVAGDPTSKPTARSDSKMSMGGSIRCQSADSKSSWRKAHWKWWNFP